MASPTVEAPTAAPTVAPTVAPTAAPAAAQVQPTTPPAATPGAAPGAAATVPAEPTPGGQPATAEAVVVNMQDIKFQPQSVTVKVGQAVEWRNLDSAPHTATSRVPQGVFDSNIMNQGATYRFTPTTAGTTEYWCLVHPEMRATLIVQ